MTVSLTKRRKQAFSLVTLLSYVMVIFMSATAANITTTTDLFAQEKKKKTLMDLFFKKKAKPKVVKKKPARKPVKKTTRLKKKKRTIARAAASAPAAPKIEIREKLENARTVLVVGDFIAGGMAEGLEIAFAESPGVRIIAAENGSSGLVREDYYNWQVALPELLEEHKPTIVVAMLGANDRQAMQIDGQSQSLRSDGWVKAYRERANAFAKAVTSTNIPLIWAGQIPYKSPKMTTDMLALNDIYRNAATNAGGAYLDLWNGFADVDGKFTTLGADINGQSVRLRARDGINITKAGKRKLAFFAEKPLRRILGGAASPQLGVLGADNLPTLSLDGPIMAAFGGMQPVSLRGPELDGGDVLLGETVEIKRPNGAQTIAEKMRIEGIIPDPR